MTCRFNDEVCWAFRLFDIDNSGSIAVAEIHESVEVWLSAVQSLQQKVHHAPAGGLGYTGRVGGGTAWQRSGHSHLPPAEAAGLWGRGGE